MAKSTFDHSEGWIEKLTLPVEGLLPEERSAIARHIVSCPACYRIVADFATLSWFLEALPAPLLPEGLPPKLLQLWEEEDRYGEQKPQWPSTDRSPVKSDEPELPEWLGKLLE